MLYIIIDESIIGAQKLLSKRKQNGKELSKALKKLTRAKNYAISEAEFLYHNLPIEYLRMPITKGLNCITYFSEKHTFVFLANSPISIHS